MPLIDKAGYMYSTTEVYQQEKLPEGRSWKTLLITVIDCLDSGAVHVCWLKSGHEVLLERNSYKYSRGH